MTGSARRMRVLVVDDDPEIRTLVAGVFSQHGCEVSSVSDGADAIGMLDHNPFDLLVLDLLLPRVDGIGVITHLAASKNPTPPILVITAAPSDTLGRLPYNHVAGVLTKPVDLDQLMQYADEAIRESHVTG